VCNSPDQAARYHIIHLYAWDFNSDLELGWLQSKDIKFTCNSYHSLKGGDHNLQLDKTNGKLSKAFFARRV
jgi:hypothetical protein